MTVARESAQAYHAIRNLEDRQQRVLDCIRKHPDSSYVDVANFTRMQKKNVSSRINELFKDSRILPTGRKINPETGRLVTTYRATHPQEEQS